MKISKTVFSHSITIYNLKLKMFKMSGNEITLITGFPVDSLANKFKTSVNNMLVSNTSCTRVNLKMK